MGKVKRLELWGQLYRTSLPVWDLENFRPMDFCWHECTSAMIVVGNHKKVSSCTRRIKILLKWSKTSFQNCTDTTMTSHTTLKGIQMNIFPSIKQDINREHESPPPRCTQSHTKWSSSKTNLRGPTGKSLGCALTVNLIFTLSVSQQHRQRAQPSCSKIKTGKKKLSMLYFPYE